MTILINVINYVNKAFSEYIDKITALQFNKCVSNTDIEYLKQYDKPISFPLQIYRKKWEARFDSLGL